MASGRLIVFEGIDRSGKSTQVRLLYEHLKNEGNNVMIVSFPERTSPITGMVLDNYLKKRSSIGSPEVSHLLFLANRWEYADVLTQRIKEGYTIIIDRYSYSGIAYTLALSHELKEWAIRMEKGLPSPDYIIYLSVDSRTTSSRGSFGEELYEVSDFQERVKACFEELMNDDGGLFPNTKRYVVSGDDTPEAIHSGIVGLL